MGNILKIYSNDGRETGYDIYVDGVFAVHVDIHPEYSITTTITNGSYSGDNTIIDTATVILSANTKYTLPSTISVTGATYTYDSSTGVVSLSNPTGNVVINVNCSIEYPSKSDTILLNLDGNGDKQYKVLKNISGTTYEVLGLFYTQSSSHFGTSNTYNGSTVDTALNSTFYNTLTQTAKSAIVDKSIQQDSLYTTTSTSASGYKAKYGTWSSSSDPTTPNNYIISTGWLASVGTRHIYALGVQDIIDYCGATTSMTFTNTTLNYENIWKMFNTTREGGNSMPSVWLRAGYGTTGQTQGMVGFLRVGSGKLETNRNDMAYGCPYPVFQIDLSKFDFTIMDNTLISFTIGSNTYQATEGMTWEEWVASAYNTGGWLVDNTRVVNSGFTRYVIYGGVEIAKTDEIVADRTYSTGIGGGGSN